MRALEEQVLIFARSNPERIAELVGSWINEEGPAEKLKAAALLVTLGPEVSAKILRHLNEQDLDGLTSEIVRLERLSPEARAAILKDCYEELMTRQFVIDGGSDYAQQLLERTQSHGES